MSPADWLRARFEVLRERLRPDPADPARVWARRQWRPLAALATAVVAVVVFDVWLATCGFEACPSRMELRTFRPTEGGRILDRNGRLIGFLSPVRRVNVKLAQVPRHVRQAFIATEDRRFHEHGGVDLRGVLRSVTRNVAALRVREGFSTISMQVARNAFVTQRMSERSLRRKLIELRITRLLEETLTKDQILELYLNIIYLGSGTYGVEAASRSYFGKTVEDLSLHEAALLAALPKGPSTYTPRRAPERAQQRRNLVLSLMVEEGYVSAAQARAAAARPLGLSPTEWRPRRGFESYAIDAVRGLADSVLQARGIDVGDVTVHTTIDAAAQRAAERAVERQAAAIRRAAGGRTPVQGALVALDPHTGDLRAIVGGSRYERAGFNRALAARRQPGSAFKPFVYAAALAAGFTPASMVDDEPVEVVQDGRIWTPANYDDEYQGTVTLRRALMRSANAATIRLSRSVGEASVVEAAQRNGIASPLAPVPAIALGALEVTPLELVAAYAPFANGGLRVQPRLVRRIEAADGTLLWSSEVQREPAMDPRDAYQITAMLRAVVDHGTGRLVRSLGVSGPVAGKTGTTNNGADVWFVGYTPSLVAGVWFGYDAPRSLGTSAAGGSMAVPAWTEFYRNGWRERAGRAWPVPDGMVERLIDAETGELATEWCPVTERAWFRPGTEPTTPCRDHIAPPGEMADDDDPWVTDLGDRIGRALRKVFSF